MFSKLVSFIDSMNKITSLVCSSNKVLVHSLQFKHLQIAPKSSLYTISSEYGGQKYQNQML